MNKHLKSKISIGLSLDISIEQYKELLQNYHYYLNSIYFSLPLGDQFHTRGKIARQFLDKENITKFYHIIELFYNAGVKLDCVLNRTSLRSDDIEKALIFIREEMPVQQITCLERDIELVNDYFPELDKIYSYNNDLNVKKISTISNLFSTVVAGKYFLRDTEALQKIVDGGFKVKLLVNNGCSFNCHGCGSDNRLCEKVFNDNLRSNSLEKLYALQSFIPEELDNLLMSHGQLIDSIKISNRTSGYDYLKNCLDSYINVSSIDPYIEQNISNYRLWLRLGWFSDKLSQLDLEKVKNEKKKLMVKNHV